MNVDVWILTFEARNVLGRQRKNQTVDLQLARVYCVILNAAWVTLRRMQISYNRPHETVIVVTVLNVDERHLVFYPRRRVIDASRRTTKWSKFDETHSELANAFQDVAATTTRLQTVRRVGESD